MGISDYLRDHPPSVDAQVQTGAWNVGSTSGFDLSQWAGSGAQQAAAEGVRELSRRWWSLAGLADGPTDRLDPTQRSRLAEVRRLVLESETSCYLFWGDDWLPKLYAITDTAGALMEELEAEQRAADVPANKNNPRTPRS